MMLPRSASEQYRLQQGVAATTAAAVGRVWRRMSDDFDASWAGTRGTLLDVVDRGRLAAVTQAVPYTAAVLRDTGQDAPATGSLVPAAFLATAPDGRDLGSLFDESVIKAKSAVAGGATAPEALAQSGRWLTMTTLTVLADTRRMVYQADIIQRPSITGYVRMLNPPSCSRCVILAGKWFRWNEGFQRHPRCDCSHIPAREDIAGDMRTDPYEAFQSLTPEQQEKTFGRSEARAIREGADIYGVVNQQVRKLPTAKSQIDQIYRTAGTRSKAISALRDRGFIRDRGQVVVPLSPGVRTDAQILAAGRGRGAVTIGGQRVTTARAARFDAAATGQRDVLNRSTMTVAERNLYDAKYRLDYALRTGTVPRSIGPSSADRFANTIPATPERIAELRQALQVQLNGLNRSGTPDSVRRLARALGLG
ncbi:hypothetical protein [Microbacterium sp. 77mftsu3.1]|uniref:hypothetical protein n=1 Tax=Microbacterium sp. 77mftsu3.1 TaxID=1761802 RepID=UPI00037D0FC1|nr:hypothetical protein [Microbacterium sp. 77mftsu3.1]SDG21858.1 hypothetical protein SAMN04488590_0218 [Microbacterium sp. 77mftsu3.1]